MFTIQTYYLAAMTSCERLTHGVIQDSRDIMASVKLIEENFLRASKAVAAATVTNGDEIKIIIQPISLPAVILEKEMLNLVFSLSNLKNAVQTRLGTTLQHLNKILRCEAEANPIITDYEALRSYQEYQQTLIKCIQMLTNINRELFITNDI